MRTNRNIILWVLLLGLLLPMLASAEAVRLNLDYPEFFGINLATERGQSLENIVAWFYALIVGIAGLAAFVMIIWGGMQWMTSAGNPTATGDAKDRIKKALLGLLLILASFVILRVINPELTTLRITGLAPVECTKDEQGQCVSFEQPQPTEQRLFLTINDQEGSVRVSPQEDVFLQWEFPGARECQASSDPAGVWTGEKTPAPAQSENLGTLGPGTYTFSLLCFTRDGERTKSVTAVVASGESSDQSKPTVDLKAEGYDGPLDFPSEELSRIRVECTWVSTGANRCIGEDEFGVPGNQQDAASGSMPLLFSGISNGQHRYTVTCINLSNGESASDTVLINVQI